MLEDDEELSIFRRLLANGGHFLPVTSVFPSTTATALSSLFTGCIPAKHGLIGRKLCLREYGGMVDMLDLTPIMSKSEQLLIEWGMEPEKFLSVPTLAETLARQGIPTYIATHRRQINHGFWKMTAFRGAVKTKGFVTSSDMWVLLRQMLTELHSERSLLVAYWGDTDTLAHRYGERSLEFELELRNLDFLLGETLKKLQDENVLFLITADHGHIDTVPEKAIDLSEDKFLQEEMVLPPGGEHRVVYLAVRNPEKVVKYLKEKYGDFAEVALRKELEARNLWGGELGDFSSRVGDVILLARENNSFVYPENDEEKMMIGRHGGLSYEEMVVPFLWKRL